MTPAKRAEAVRTVLVAHEDVLKVINDLRDYIYDLETALKDAKAENTLLTTHLNNAYTQLTNAHAQIGELVDRIDELEAA